MGYKEITLEDISAKEESYQNFLPLLAAPILGTSFAIGSKKEKEAQKKRQEEIARSQQASRDEYERTKGKVASIDLSNKTCDELDAAYADVINKLADQYNLNESQKKGLEEQKSLIEGKIKEQKCAEERAKAANEKIKEAEARLVQVETDKKAKQKKVLTYAGIGVGGLIALIVIIKILR